jgi:hypothetical protein
MEPKPITESKTIVVNAIVAILLFIDYMTGSMVAQWVQDVTGAESVEAAVLVIINVWLRFKTHSPVRFNLFAGLL